MLYPWGDRLVHSAAMGTSDWSPGKAPCDPHLTADGSEQVAAVCYRVRAVTLELLLVRTRKGRWTFPKGRSEAGLTHAQAAGIEAFEEAGVEGRIEETPFFRYFRGKRSHVKDPGAVANIVHAYLCEVLRLLPPQEPNRNRTWFPVEGAKDELRQGRTPENAAEMVRVVDAAVARIRRLRS